MNKDVTTSDIHEAAYYILSGNELASIEARNINGKIICSFTLRGENITIHQISYLNGEAAANILNLRRMVSQLQAWSYAAKKKYQNQLACSEHGGAL
jgi:hypothetical protein